ncbi:cytochrome P450 [Mycena latifolia]|nr:cytochrome P450 [Mycena latifolia]
MDGSDRQNFHIVALAAAAVCTMVLLRLIRSRSYDSNPVATVPGPSSPSWIYGNMIQLVLAKDYGTYEFEWQKQYGPLYRVKGCFGEDRLIVSDPQALKHILNNPTFIRSPSTSKTFHLVFGEESVFCVEGEEHRRLRAAMSAAFSGKGVRNFLPVFVDVARKITHEWDNSCSSGSSTRLNVGNMFSHATLDIICDAALGLPVNTVQNPEHPLAITHLHILASAFMSSKSRLLAQFFTAYMPGWLLRRALHLPVGRFSALLSFKNITAQLMAEKGRNFEMDVGEKRDLLSAILAGRGANKSAVTPSQLLNQIPLLLVAGQDTTAAALSWALNWVSQNPEFQQKLRQEILASKLKLQEDGLDYDSMPLLNALIKETLRMFPPGPLFERSAGEDCVLPLSSEIVTSTGKHIRELPIQKGQIISLALASYQRLETLWGPDADVFNPSRWLEGDPFKGQASALGPYAHLSAFLGGHRVCAGWRFALLEMQVLLTELLAKFSFSPLKDGVVRAHFAGSQFPVDGEGVKGLWLSVEPVCN